jgi:type II secretory pathway pseudopilin PulG
MKNWARGVRSEEREGGSRKAGKKSSIRSRHGFTLVELLVASTLLIIAIVSIVTIVRKGAEIEVADRHRRTARSVIKSQFESATYSRANYATMANLTQAVVIDPRNAGPGDDLSGTLTITVSAPQTIAAASATTITFRAVSATVTWTEPEGQQTVSLIKDVTP